MIKSLSIFPSQCALNSKPVIDALLRSARAAGIQICTNSWSADAVLLWSVLWHGRMRPNQKVYQHYRQQGRPVIVAEVGSLRRNHTWKVAINDITADGFYGHDRDLDPDRPRSLGLSLSIQKTRAPHVLVACQNNNSLQMQSVGDQSAWINRVVTDLRRVSDRPVRIRPHPRSPLHYNFPHPNVEIQLPRKIPHTYDDFDIDFACHTVININSGPGIQANFFHTPVIVDRSSLAYPVSISIQDIESPPDRDIDRWLIEIAHTEYVIPELEQGLWLKRLRSKL